MQTPTTISRAVRLVLHSAMGKYKRMKLDQSDLPPQDFSDSEEDGENKDRKRKAPRSSANARERARMRVLSKAFVKLKTTLPWVPADTKLSKLDTLRLAACYISHLRYLLNPENPVQATTPRMPNPLSMVGK